MVEATVTVDVAGGERHEVGVPRDGTYGDLLRAVDLSPHEATVLVHDRPQPADTPVGETTHVQVLRLVRGG